MPVLLCVACCRGSGPGSGDPLLITSIFLIGAISVRSLAGLLGSADLRRFRLRNIGGAAVKLSFRPVDISAGLRLAPCPRADAVTLAETESRSGVLLVTTTGGSSSEDWIASTDLSIAAGACKLFGLIALTADASMPA